MELIYHIPNSRTNQHISMMPLKPLHVRCQPLHKPKEAYGMYDAKESFGHYEQKEPITPKL